MINKALLALALGMALVAASNSDEEQASPDTPDLQEDEDGEGSDQ